MPISPEQKNAIEEVISAILALTTSRGKRQLAAIFMDLVDRAEWPEYYEVIPEPRCLKNIQSGVAKGRYKESRDVYTDLSLVFWNALFYNESGSQIATDAAILKTTLETEWKKRPVLPATRSSPPPSSAQKVHGDASLEAKEEPETTASTTPALPTPAVTAPVRTITPAQPPTASTSTSHYRPVPIRPKSTQRIPSPDADVDVVSPESDDDGADFQAERDPQSEEIVKQLEKGLPRWPGFGEEGWMKEVHPERYSDIVHAIKTFKDVVGNRVAVCLESLPEESSPTLHLSSTAPISLKQIETRARHKMYKSSKDFDLEMARLFEKARRWHEPGSEAYGRALLLQRLYQAITSPNPPTPPYIPSTNFASLRAGPGNVKPVHKSDGEGVANVTTHRVLTRDRTFVDEVNYKGWKIKLADCVHLSNPDDPSRPIIGQVFRCWVSEEPEKKGQPGITVSWYYRPEQTFHPANRVFWEGEIFKTSHFADHPVEDIIEKIACQFTARHIRGRPRPPFWYPGFPLYVCDSRYNDRERVFVRIKNWNSCVPEEVRQKEEFMPIYPFERTVYPVKLPSPFLVKGTSTKAAVKGPGGLITGTNNEQAEGPQEGRRHHHAARQEAPSRAASSAPQSQLAVPSATGHYPHFTAYVPQQPLQVGRVAGPDRSVVSSAGGVAAIGGPAQVEKLPPETVKLFDRDPETNEVLWFAAPPLNMARAKGPCYSLAYLQFLAAKRKRGTTEEEDANDDADGRDAGSTEPATKRARKLLYPQSVMEITKQVLSGVGDDLEDGVNL
ncbi:hypothetical protein M413DRAFT_447403 [Hebeloma cylindrosporum]|uniref:BAH domain-containing protein n=1 Tax=Hebeloma cylindrosporum TaxID=76867 RepID=A0A0C3C432_HEBCY|nr:hypothetical protein M413DRAFT_447403 [Hebeloma cylindrosporum h7]